MLTGVITKRYLDTFLLSSFYYVIDGIDWE